MLTMNPSIGDVGDAALAMMVVKSCEGIEGGLPPALRMKMLINVILDFIVGLVPFIGDLADAVYKANTRNAIILEGHLREMGAKAASQRSRRRQEPIVDVDNSLPDAFDRQEHGVEDNRPPAYDNVNPTAPHPTGQSRSKSFGRWFGGASHPEADLERGGAR
jgi:hypothetical protein